MCTLVSGTHPFSLVLDQLQRNATTLSFACTPSSRGLILLPDTFDMRLLRVLRFWTLVATRHCQTSNLSKLLRTIQLHLYASNGNYICGATKLCNCPHGLYPVSINVTRALSDSINVGGASVQWLSSADSRVYGMWFASDSAAITEHVV